MIYLVINLINIRRKKVKIGHKVKVNGLLGIHGRKKSISIGNNCTIVSTDYVNPTSGNIHTHLRAEGNGFIYIGNNVGISNANITSFSGITIDDNVLIGSGVKIWDTDFHSIDYFNRMNDLDVCSKPIYINEGAFIGACSIILKGVSIGEHSVIGAGSVVTKNVPDYEIWAGNPAKFIEKIKQ